MSGPGAKTFNTDEFAIKVYSLLLTDSNTISQKVSLVYAVGGLF